MSPLAKEIIEKLNKEDDAQVLAEVLDFYEYLKQKKSKNFHKGWKYIDEDESTKEEIELYQKYKQSKEELTPLVDIMKELNLDE
jgi:hypothetical protein